MNLSREQLLERFPRATESFLRANAAQGASAPSPVKSGPPEAVSVAKKRIRQGPGLNKTEQAFMDYLVVRHGSGVLAQAVTLKLGNGVRYTPDFFLATDATNGHEERVTCCRAWEVKGFMREDSVVKLKVAASLYPWISFSLVTKRRKKDGGGWDIQVIVP